MTDNPELNSAFTENLTSLINDFLQQFLADQPEDAYEYAAQYFSIEWNKRQDQLKLREEILRALGSRGKRRNAIFDINGDVSEIEVPDEKYPKPTEQRERIKLQIEDHVSFINLDDDVLVRIINSMEPMEVAEGDTVVNQGDEEDTFFVVESGTFDASVQDEDKNERVVKTYEDDGYFCDIALIHGESSPVTITATTEGRLLRLTRTTYKNLVRHYQCMKIKRYMDYIAKVPILSVLEEEEKLKICNAMKVTTINKGDVLYEKGEEAGAVYFVQKGTLSMTSETEGGEEKVIEHVEGDCLGELALLQEGTRNATVKAIEDCELAFLNVDAFERLLGPCKKLMEEHAEKYEDHRPKKKDDN